MFLNRAVESNAILTVDAEVESQPVRFLRFVADADVMISSTEIKKILTVGIAVVL